MKSLGSLRMGLISETPTVAATALVVPAGKGETCRLEDETPPVPPTQFHCELSEAEQQDYLSNRLCFLLHVKQSQLKTFNGV